MQLGSALLLVITGPLWWACAAPEEAPTEDATLRVVETDTHRFEEMAPGVYFAVGTGSVFVQSNAMVVVNDDDVLIVDSHVSAAAGQALLDSVAHLTDKPVRYLVNTHYHFDHAHGNQVFGDDVVIIGHEFTREKLLGDVLEQATYKLFTSGLPGAVEQMTASLEGIEDAGEREQLEAQIAIQAAHIEALEEVVPTPPSVTLSSRMSIQRGDRRIELLHLGRAHTGGDIVVFLPAEKILFTGDLLVPGPSYMGDGYADEWVETLDRLKELDFDWILPGHGPATQDRGIIDLNQAILGSLWEQASAARSNGLSAEEAAASIDVIELLSPFPDNAFSQMPSEVLQAVHQRQVGRTYELMEEREAE